MQIRVESSLTVKVGNNYVKHSAAAEVDKDDLLDLADQIDLDDDALVVDKIRAFVRSLQEITQDGVWEAVVADIEDLTDDEPRPNKRRQDQ